MKKLIKVFLLFSLLSIGMVSSCIEDVGGDPRVRSISIKEETLLESYELGTFDLTTVQILVGFSDGSMETINLDTSMIEQSDLLKLGMAGIHKITVEYGGKTRTFTVKLHQVDPETTLLLIYQLGVESGNIDMTYEEWVESIRGEDGQDGKNVLFQVSEGYIQWQYEGDREWVDLIAVASLIGSAGHDGEDGISIVDAVINEDDELVFELSDGSLIHVGNVMGPDSLNGEDGLNGLDGLDGVGIESIIINESGELIMTLTDETVLNLGNVTGSNGQDGEDGISIVGAEINQNGELIISFSDESSHNLGLIVGKDKDYEYLFSRSRNLLNLDDEDFQPFHYLHSNGGLIPYEHYHVTGYIDVDQGDNLVLSYDSHGNRAQGMMRFVTAYSASREVIPLEGDEKVYEYMVPSGVKYVRVTYSSNYQKVQIEKNDHITDYEAYYVRIRHEFMPRPMLDANIFLPDDIYVSVGETVEVYNDQVVLDHPGNLYVQWDSAIGETGNRKFSVTGTKERVGQYVLGLTVYDDELEEIYHKDSTIHIVDDTTKGKKNVLIIGDDGAVNREWIDELIIRGDGSIDLVGTKPIDTDISGNQYYEAMSGWTPGWLLEDDSPSNPFYHDETDSFDWNHYLETHELQVDMIVLSFHDIYGSDFDESGFMTDLEEIIEKIKTDDEHVQIYLMSPVHPSPLDPLGYSKKRTVMRMTEDLFELCSGRDDTFLVPLGPLHDSTYNYDVESVPVNPFSDQFEPKLVDAFHPNSWGQQQIASILYSTICALSEISSVENQSPTIYLVGDSTVSNYNDQTNYYPLNGYGMQLSYYFYNNVTVSNLAISGASSKSFINSNNYQTLLSEIKAGDYLLIGFGHNDEKKDANRYTNPIAPITDQSSFRYYLYEYYIRVALESGATPVLMTPIVRRTNTGVWSNSNLHVTSDSEGYPGGDYAQCIRDLGDEMNISVVDLTSLSKALYDDLGPRETAYLHKWTTEDVETVDNTHLNPYGARSICFLVANELIRMGHPLHLYLLEITDPPSKDILTS